jgi:thiamine-monophosphate kinase
MRGEFDLIERYFRNLTAAGDDARAGIGGDCARVIVPDNTELAVSIDTVLEGVHFPCDTAAADVGWKALVASLSDLAAAGASPRWCTLALTLTQIDEAWLKGFSVGLAEAAATYGIALVGGDTTQGKQLTATVQVGGHVPAGLALNRSGARAGDAVWVSGWPGEAAAGLACWQRTTGADVTPLERRLARPSARVDLGRALRGSASACIDISDGLAQDAGHLADASGVALVLEELVLPCSAGLAEAGDSAQRLAWILHGGDDYELLATIPDSRRQPDDGGEQDPVTLTRIGTVETGEGVWLRRISGRLERLADAGYRHFAR